MTPATTIPLTINAMLVFGLASASASSFFFKSSANGFNASLASVTAFSSFALRSADGSLASFKAFSASSTFF